MKKWLKSLTVLAAVALVLIPCCLLSACGNSHPAKGDTYVFDSVNIEWTDELLGQLEQQEMTKESFEAMAKQQFVGAEIIFTSKTEVKMVMGGQETDAMPYTVVDGKVKIGEDGKEGELIIDGKTLKMDQYGVTVIFKLK